MYLDEKKIDKIEQDLKKLSYRWFISTVFTKVSIGYFIITLLIHHFILVNESFDKIFTLLERIGANLFTISVVMEGIFLRKIANKQKEFTNMLLDTVSFYQKRSINEVLDLIAKTEENKK